MEWKEEFAPRFRLALQALGLSRGRAAQQLRVDKSLVGRWASGTVRPSEHNLSAVTDLVASRIPGFTMFDWQRDFASFAGRFPIEFTADATEVPEEAAAGLPLGYLVHVKAETERKGAAYSGFWRSTRPSVLVHGKLFFDYLIFRLAANGFLDVRVNSSGLSFDGWGYVSEGNLVVFLADPVGSTPVSLIFKGVPLPKAMLLDGLLLHAGFDSARTPAAVPIIIERIGDLSGDKEADEATFAEFGERGFAADDEVPDPVRRHLIRDVGPGTAAAGGDMFLVASGVLSRGASSSGWEG